MLVANWSTTEPTRDVAREIGKGYLICIELILFSQIFSNIKDILEELFKTYMCDQDGVVEWNEFRLMW